MSNPLTTSVICPILIGRTPHLETVDDHLHQVSQGQGQVMLIAGEAGLGKSRLVAEIQLRAAQHGWHTTQGHCFKTEQALPYAPLIDWLRAFGLAHSVATLAKYLGPAGVELAALLPELAGQLPPPDVPIPDKHHLFYLLAQFCLRLAEEQPLLVVIEDLHWSDDTSLELLLYLARHLTTRPVLFVFTYRSDETGPGLTHFLAQLDRGRLATEIALSPLTREQVDRMLQAIFNQPRPTRLEFLETLYALTEGNPFFIEELLKSMLMAGDIFYAEDGIWDRKPLHELYIPRSVQAAVQQRRRQLSPNTQQLLNLAAVVGRHFDFTLLQRLTNHSEAELLLQFKELMAAQFITEESAEQFAFRHALTREAIYTTLLVRERRYWHQRIAEALEQLYGHVPNPPLADLSYHFYQGEVWDRTLVYAQQAGERASKLYAPQSAITHFSHALQAAPHLSAAFLPQLFYQRGQAYATLNNFEAAMADYQTALEMSIAQNNPHTQWQTLLALGNLWATRDYTRPGDYFQQAQTLAQSIANPQMIAHSLNTIGNWQMNGGQPFAAVQTHQEALAIFKSLNNPPGLAQTLDYLAISSYNCADITQSRAYYQQVIPLWEKLEDDQGLLHSFGGLALGADYELAYDEVPITQAIAWGERGVQVARRIGWRSGEAFTLICWGMALRHNGQWGAAITQYRQALAAAEEIEHNGWTIDARLALGVLYLDLLALPEARPYLEETLALARQFNAFIWINYTSLALAGVYIVQQAFDLARARLDELLPATGPMATLHHRFVWLARAELALAEGAYETALEIIERLIASALNLPSTPSGQVIPRLWLVRGQALSGLGRQPQAEDDLLAGLKTAQAQGRVRLFWRLYAALAQVYLAQGKIELAERALAATRANIETLAGSAANESLPQVGALGDYFIRQATAMLPSVSSTPPKTKPAKPAAGGLTPREREVAILVAQGQSNREIAESLVLSERTAERHVANIMSKLGFNSRAQIAAWAVKNYKL